MRLLEAKNGNPDQTALQDTSAMDSARDFAHGQFVARPVYSSTIRVNGSWSATKVPLGICMNTIQMPPNSNGAAPDGRQ